MMSQPDLTVTQIVNEMKSYQENLNDLQEALVLRAELREITELQFNALVQLAKEGIEFLNIMHRGDIIERKWIEKRDDLIERAQLLIQDAPL